MQDPNEAVPAWPFLCERTGELGDHALQSLVYPVLMLQHFCWESGPRIFHDEITTTRILSAIEARSNVKCKNAGFETGMASLKCVQGLLTLFGFHADRVVMDRLGYVDDDLKTPNVCSDGFEKWRNIAGGVEIAVVEVSFNPEDAILEQSLFCCLLEYVVHSAKRVLCIEK